MNTYTHTYIYTFLNSDGMATVYSVNNIQHICSCTSVMDGNFYDPKPNNCNIHYTLGRTYPEGRVIAPSSPFETSCIQKRALDKGTKESLLMGHLLMSTYLGNVSIWQNVVPVGQFNSNILCILHGYTVLHQ